MEVETARLCLLLHKLPSEVEAESYQKLISVLQVNDALEELRKAKA